MEEINPEKNNNENLSLNYINLLNSLIVSLNSSPLKTLEELSNDSFLYSLIIEIEPSFENIFLNNLVLNLEDTEIKQSNLNFIINSLENHMKDKLGNKKIFPYKISVDKIINKDLDELIKLSEMLIILTIISANKNTFIEKMNQIEDNTLNKLYYSLTKKYISFNPIDNIKIKPTQINPSIFDNEEENNSNNNTQEKIIESLQNENEDLHRTIDNLCIEKQELQALVDKLNSTIKESELDYNKLKEEYDIKEQNYSGIIMNNKTVIEKLNTELKNEMKYNQNIKEEKKLLLNELNKNKESIDELILIKKKLEEKDNVIKKLVEKNKENEILKEKVEENDYYKKSYEEQKIRVNEEHKLISESLYKLAIHFMTLKDDLQNRINSAKNGNK